VEWIPKILLESSALITIKVKEIRINTAMVKEKYCLNRDPNNEAYTDSI
jgi:hypothetical protein